METSVYPAQADPRELGTSLSIPKQIAEKVLTIGLEHRKYEGGIGYVMNVYEKYFSVFKYVTTYKRFPSKLKLIFFFISQYVKLIKTLLQDKSIEIVHIHGAAYGSFYRKFLIFLTSRYLFGKKTIYHVHASEFKKFYEGSGYLGKKLIACMVENADVLICLSKSWETYFNTHFSVKRIEILDNIVNLADQQHKDYIDSGPVRPLRLLFLGLIGHRKGVFDLVDMVRQNKAVLQGRLEVIIGGNGEVDKLNDYIRQHQLESLVRFEGWVSGDHKHRLLSESDLFVLPSYNEGLPISILEAMSYQLPILSTPVGGTPEIVQHGLNGFLFEPGDKKALFQFLMNFVDRPKLIAQMGQESERISKRYSPVTVIPQLLDIYKSILN